MVSDLQIANVLIMSQGWGRNSGLMEQKLTRKARFTCVVSAFLVQGIGELGDGRID